MTHVRESSSSGVSSGAWMSRAQPNVSAMVSKAGREWRGMACEVVNIASH